MIVDDPDVKPHAFTMWTVWDIAVRFRALPEQGISDRSPVPGSRIGRNDNGAVGYAGPCFPERSGHHYRWTVYALSGRPALAQAASPGQVRRAIAPLIVGYGLLVAKGY